MEAFRRMLHDRRDWLLTLGVVATAAGFVVVGLGWFGAARKDTVPEQFPYVLSGGITGLGLLLVGAALIVTQSFRRDHDRVHAELAELREELAHREHAVDTVSNGHREEPIVVVGRSSYHDRECHLVSERGEADEVVVSEAAERGLEPCRICKPPVATVSPREAARS